VQNAKFCLKVKHLASEATPRLGLTPDPTSQVRPDF
jgi:hypothetical protein